MVQIAMLGAAAMRLVAGLELVETQVVNRVPIDLVQPMVVQLMVVYGWWGNKSWVAVIQGHPTGC